MSGRRTKPNRGGGRFNKPRGGGGGGGGGRKAAAGDWDDGDDFSLDLGQRRTFKPNTSRGSGAGRGGHRGRGRAQGPPRKYEDQQKRERFRPEHVQLPLQKIHMTSENKLQVKELLRELQNPEYHATHRWGCYIDHLYYNKHKGNGLIPKEHKCIPQWCNLVM